MTGGLLALWTWRGIDLPAALLVAVFSAAAGYALARPVEHMLVKCLATPASQAEFQEHVGPENMCRSIEEALNRARVAYAEAAKRHPIGTVWGRRSTDVLEPEREAPPEPSAALKEIT